MSRPVMKVVRLGLVSYSEAMRVQRFYVDRLKSRPGSAWTLLLCEHKPVFTVGIRTGLYPDPDLDSLRTTGADVHKSDRGGLITFHGPGQLVCYPIMHLGLLKKGIRWYVSQLEQTVLDVCSDFGLKAETSPHTGVWIGNDKICAMGIHCSRYVTSHGLALNCDVDLSWFSHIVPCGLSDKGVTSLSRETQQKISVEQSVPPLLRAISKHFNCQLQDPPLIQS
ncbi:octanoyl-[acyl-carrier-protein]:protein N-octanoyltransferase LIPT2, mitochondrial [Eucyclogobius newberryi]|uniref:octanoyl-[acyl-carrier-protein]:protein N-octanoyltransferase LIPT2, mitochondrial n=1 Tax=Eucyclogobius newberryi TaxID=166745 RepID=UPI003B596661